MGVRWQWLVIAILALLGAAGGAYLGDRVAPDVVGVLASMAVVGFGLGALIGVIVSGWWRPPPKPVEASSASEETEFTARAQDDPRTTLSPSTLPLWSSTAAASAP